MGSDYSVRRQMPVLIGNNDHVMALAEITREPNKVTIVVQAVGEDSQYIANLLEQTEPIGISFIALPIQNAREKRPI